MPDSEPIVGFDAIVGQRRPIRILATLLRKGLIPHALLFSGIDGIGKRTVALALAMACNCTGSRPASAPDGTLPPVETPNPDKQQRDAKVPCGTCRSCRKIRSGNHPDIIHVGPSGAIIRISQIRELCRILAMKPYEARSRVVILADAQTMNPEASNALLKVLEEPPARTILILIASQASDLLPTITSRCQQIPFSPIGGSILEAYLVENRGLTPADAAISASMAKGSLARALSVNHRGWSKRRNWLIEAIGLDKPATLASLSPDSLLAFAEKLSKDRKQLAESLEVMQAWIRDLVIHKVSPGKVVNRDLMTSIENASQQVSTERLLDGFSATQAAARAVEGNANLRLTAETLVMRLAGRIDPPAAVTARKGR